MLKNITPRLYQETIFNTCVKKNCLVVLPTGMGKTLIAIMLSIQRLKQYPNSKILFLSPTKPLVEQHFKTFEKHIDIDNEKFTVFTGMIKPEKRAQLWKEKQVIFSTPQGLENDILSKKISMEEVSLLVIDEAHRAVGDYAYVFLAKHYNRYGKYSRILSLTASPGSDLEKINEVSNNLYVEEVEIRTDNDPDVKPYVQEVNIKWEKVKLPLELQETKKYFEDCFKSKLSEIKSLGYVNSTSLNKKDLLILQGQIHGLIAKGEKDSAIWRSLSLIAESIKVQHALELLETQGTDSLIKYLEKIEYESENGKTKAAKNLSRDLNFRTAGVKAKKYQLSNQEYPKITKLKEIFSKYKGKTIIFSQFRDSAESIANSINQIPNIQAEIFVGQAKKGNTGLSQKEQIKMLDRFRNDEFNVLVSTSVAEEGLDIPKVDNVIFYEPIPSAIRHIQRRGRTGRSDKGNVIILITEGTRDEGYRWSAHHKEKRMYKILSDLRSKIILPKKQTKLNEFSNLKIYVDFREKGSAVIKNLIDRGVEIEMHTLQSSDFILGSRVAVEFKTGEDFVNSIIDGRLLSQVKTLKENFVRPLVIVQGEDLYNLRKVPANAIRGMIATITVDYGIPIIQTKNSRETAEMLISIAKREQEKTGKHFSYHTEKKSLSLKEQQEYIVSALPSIGPAIAIPLLKHFGSIKEIFNASDLALKEVSLVGEIKSKKIREIIDSKY